MKVFWLPSGEILNVESDCPSLKLIMEAEGEEIPIGIFGKYPHFADKQNTRKEDGEWVFDFDVAAQTEKEAAAAKSVVRTDRDQLLTASDWTQIEDAPLSAEDKAAWADYRQALRDLPQQSGFPDSCIWPSPPKQ